MQRDSLPARRRYTRLAGSADALALARLAQEEHPIGVVSATALDAQRLLDEICWFAPQLRVCLLPDWETLPYDQFSPHHDLVSERLATLYRIQRGDFDVAVVPAATALVRLCPPAYIAAHTFFLRTGATLDVEQLRAQLATAGYQHVTQVVAPGEVCVGGDQRFLARHPEPLPHAGRRPGPAAARAGADVRRGRGVLPAGEGASAPRRAGGR